jgi:hypothetical protein
MTLSLLVDERLWRTEHDQNAWANVQEESASFLMSGIAFSLAG